MANLACPKEAFNIRAVMMDEYQKSANWNHPRIVTMLCASSICWDQVLWYAKASKSAAWERTNHSKHSKHTQVSQVSQAQANANKEQVALVAVARWILPS